jgi:hypothetical protein
MMDFASTQARGKGVTPTASREEGHTEVAVASPPKASPLPTADGVDKMHRQLVVIHAIAIVQLAECARSCWSNPTSNAAHADVGW